MDFSVKSQIQTTSVASQIVKSHPSVVELNLQSLLKDLFLALSNREKDVIVKRFSLENKKKETLEHLGMKFSVTRERIRQIEAMALNKLRRIIHTTELHFFNKLAQQTLFNQGGIMEEQMFFDSLFNRLPSHANNKNAIQLILLLDSSFFCDRAGHNHKSYWRLNLLSNDIIKLSMNEAVSFLEKCHTLVSTDAILSHLRKKNLLNGEISDPQFQDSFFKNILAVDQRLICFNGCYGLKEWRDINPRSIRDKACVVLKSSGQPLHFNEVAKRINNIGLCKKSVTVEAVHNELIRFHRFVLVGRGIYALKEWGYPVGTVADLIESLLLNKKQMTKHEIVTAILKQRIVKQGTISLNLQKYPQFERIGRAVYTLNLRKKKEEK